MEKFAFAKIYLRKIPFPETRTAQPSPQANPKFVTFFIKNLFFLFFILFLRL